MPMILTCLATRTFLQTEQKFINVVKPFISVELILIPVWCVTFSLWHRLTHRKYDDAAGENCDGEEVVREAQTE